jgi:hypothetical protein
MGHVEQCSAKFVSPLSPWSKIFVEKLIVTELDKKFPTFYGT